MKRFFLAVVVAGFALPLCAQSDFPRGVVVDNFNDGVISAIWNAYAGQDSRVYEQDGVLNADIAAGSQQVAGVSTRDFMLTGDCDVHVDFELSSEYHWTPESNTKLILNDRSGNGVELSIRTGHYLSTEYLGTGSNVNFMITPTDDLSGKLRVSRVGNHITTYFWQNGWRKHADWTPVATSGDLRITIDSWSWPPYFYAFSTKFDNVVASKADVTVCHLQGNGGRQTLTVSLAALQAHLAHGDWIGPCQ